MVEGESSNARETRLKMQADLKRMDQRMEEIGVNLVQEEGNGSPNEEGSDETESEEEGEEVNQLVDEDDQEGNQDEPMEEAEAEQEEDEAPHVPRALQCSLLHGLCETKYPHDDTMKALGIFEDVELVSRTCNWKFFSHRMEVYKELTSKGEKKMVTFRQLGDLVWVHYGEGNLWNIKEEELQRVGLQSLRGTLPQGPRLPDQSPVLRYVHKALANTFFARKARDNQ
ncbi:unnamed protein product [Microthlaspi erraticum]|uniref:Arabidopsis retrotransposon Orf1 C-terminal domain-containing protein n=1 Tax=Microthlaspi erraticum TaxID=1685480 RepID=A0A6D2L9L4_9BRAS|nr:unnamed protein product [Microthlaspi erraticum]